MELGVRTTLHPSENFLNFLNKGFEMKNLMGRLSRGCCVRWAAVGLIVALVGMSMGCSLAVAADTTAATPEQEAAYTFNTIVMFVCAVLVLFMQAGFAMLEVGMNAAKNTINILFKNVMDLSVGVLLFFFVGFGLMYPGADYEGKWFGFGGAGIGGLEMGPVVDATSDYSPSADFIFQVAFAATAATIVSGAVAGRMQFKSYLVYSAVLTGFIYPISGMWKWGGGWLDAMGFQDFAGSVVVHAVGGFAGLAGAIVLGPRIGRFVQGKSVAMPGHNITFAALGVLILWVGWYGFNPGSQLTYWGASNANATAYIAVTTTLSAAAGAVAAMLVGWVMFRKARCDNGPQWCTGWFGRDYGQLRSGRALGFDCHWTRRGSFGGRRHCVARQIVDRRSGGRVARTRVVRYLGRACHGYLRHRRGSLFPHPTDRNGSDLCLGIFHDVDSVWNPQSHGALAGLGRGRDPRTGH